MKPGLRILILLLAAIALSLALRIQILNKNNPCWQGKSLNIVAHEDDDLLFLNPDIARDIKSGKCSITVFLTAGNVNNGKSYWLARETGAKAAYSQMADFTNYWYENKSEVLGHPVNQLILAGNTKVSLIFMRLPDGGADGKGFPAGGYQSLQKLWQGDITRLKSVDGATSYTKDDLTDILLYLMKTFKPNVIRTGDFSEGYGKGDHSDHYSAANFTRLANESYFDSHVLLGYRGYWSSLWEANIEGDDKQQKEETYLTYAKYDSDTCGTEASCSATGYKDWWGREYVASTLETNMKDQKNLFLFAKDRLGLF